MPNIVDWIYKLPHSECAPSPDINPNDRAWVIISQEEIYGNLNSCLLLKEQFKTAWDDVKKDAQKEKNSEIDEIDAERIFIDRFLMFGMIKIKEGKSKDGSSFSSIAEVLGTEEKELLCLFAQNLLKARKETQNCPFTIYARETPTGGITYSVLEISEGILLK